MKEASILKRTRAIDSIGDWWLVSKGRASVGGRRREVKARAERLLRATRATEAKRSARPGNAKRSLDEPSSHPVAK